MVKGPGGKEHVRDVPYLARVPVSDRSVEEPRGTEHAARVRDFGRVPVGDGGLVETRCDVKHLVHVSDPGRVPRSDVVVETAGVLEHFVHVRDPGGVPAIQAPMELLSLRKGPRHVRHQRRVPAVHRYVHHVDGAQGRVIGHAPAVDENVRIHAVAQEFGKGVAVAVAVASSGALGAFVSAQQFDQGPGGTEILAVILALARHAGSFVDEFVKVVAAVERIGGQPAGTIRKRGGGRRAAAAVVVAARWWFRACGTDRSFDFEVRFVSEGSVSIPVLEDVVAIVVAIATVVVVVPEIKVVPVRHLVVGVVVVDAVPVGFVQPGAGIADSHGNAVVVLAVVRVLVVVRVLIVVLVLVVVLVPIPVVARKCIVTNHVGKNANVGVRGASLVAVVLVAVHGIGIGIEDAQIKIDGVNTERIVRSGKATSLEGFGFE
mmetsp:Transcript_24601/g.53901  ORF Transcript_24601/g.53901 Transcript_24601/m.53901 type:complete len:432 (-) Transcript_24601:229-1524(-)